MNLTETAQKFDEATFNYTPSPDIRGFGAQLAHVANSQFNACAAAKGEANPHQGSNLEKTKTTRADIIQALADSFAFCDPAFANLTDQSALELVRQGQNEVARGSVLTNLIVARQRGIRNPDGLYAHEGHGPAIDRARHARTGSSGSAACGADARTE